MDDKALLSEALARASGLPQAALEPLLEVPPTPDMGDYALPCFKLAKTLRKPPAAIAQALADDRAFPGRSIEVSDEAAGFLASVSEGDARRTLTALELAVLPTPPGEDGVIRVG